MSSDFAAVTRWVDKVGQAVSPSAIRRMEAKGAEAGKRAALEAATESLGGDRRFRNFPRAGALTAHTDGGVVGMGGPWPLAESGRRRTGIERPRSARALRTPYGPKARVRYGRSRGLKTYSHASKKAQTTVPKAVHDQFVSELRSAT